VAFTPYSWITYPGDDTTDSFVVPFPYVKREHVRVFIDWDPSTRSFAAELTHDTDFDWADATSIVTTVGPATGETISLVRETPIDEQLTEWQAGSPPTSFELNTADLQVLYALQEFVDRTLQTREDLDEAVFSGSGTVLIDNLNSTLTTAGLTANQGRTLRLLVEAAQDDAEDAGTTADTAVADAAAAQAAADAAQADADAALPKAGGTMTGKITLDGDPSASLHAATKQYVDGQAGLVDAFVNFTVSGMVINSSRNVSSVTYLGVGSYQINFTTPFPNSGYAWAGTARGNASNNLWLGHALSASKTASSIEVGSYLATTTASEASEVSFLAIA
jgi:hypothetical protein